MSDHNLREPAGDFGTLMEVRLLRWGESSTAGRTITLELHPDEGEAHPFKTFPSGAKNGQRFWMVLRPIADDEQPIPAPPVTVAAAPPHDVAPDRGTTGASPLPASHRDGGERPKIVRHGAIHTPDLDSSVLDGGAKTGPQRGCGASAARDRYAVMSSGEKAVARAAMLPKDERFRAWVASEMSGPARIADDQVGENTAVWYIRERCCGGGSRKLIAEDPEAMDKFIALETAFKIAVGEIAEPR